MIPEERARQLRREADQVLVKIRLREHCADIGEIIPTGSYFLDVMVYPDIDLYLPPTSPERLLALGCQLAQYDCVRRLNFAKGGPGDLRDGFYLKPVIEMGNWERAWKVDMWALPLAVVEKKQRELTALKERMTAGQRRRIVEYKLSILKDSGRTPMFSGIYIYRAVINHGLENSEDISNYLRKNSIDI